MVNGPWQTFSPAVNDKKGFYKAKIKLLIKEFEEKGNFRNIWKMFGSAESNIHVWRSTISINLKSQRFWISLSRLWFFWLWSFFNFQCQRGPHRMNRTSLVFRAKFKPNQSCKKAVSWYEGYRTFLKEIPDFFGYLS